MSQLSANYRGALLMTGSMAAFTINDTFMKMLGQDIPFFQLLFLRSLGTLAILLFLAKRAGVLRAPVGTKDRWIIVIRTVSEIGAAYFFINALIKLPIANVTAIIQALPLTVALGAALFFKEPVGWRRFAAIFVGFAGVMLIVRPGGSDFNLYSLFGLAAVVCVTVRDLAARRLSPEVPSLLVSAFTAAGVLAFGTIGAMGTDWVAMDARDFLLLACAIVMIVGGYLFSVMAMRVGDIGFVAPFRYTSLLVALIAGLLVFGHWPDSLTMLGATIVVATGLFTLWRERALERLKPAE
ncbi:MAG: DMT family transporter [Boseongicola sp.]|nr:DMT family transporter [Boseongicola sp.]